MDTIIRATCTPERDGRVRGSHHSGDTRSGTSHAAHCSNGVGGRSLPNNSSNTSSLFPSVAHSVNYCSVCCTVLRKCLYCTFPSTVHLKMLSNSNISAKSRTTVRKSGNVPHFHVHSRLATTQYFYKNLNILNIIYITLR